MVVLLAVVVVNLAALAPQPEGAHPSIPTHHTPITFTPAIRMPMPTTEALITPMATAPKLSTPIGTTPMLTTPMGTMPIEMMPRGAMPMARIFGRPPQAGWDWSGRDSGGTGCGISADWDWTSGPSPHHGWRRASNGCPSCGPLGS